MTERRPALDSLDVVLLEALDAHPRAGALELSRRLGISRATVQARLARLEAAGVITGFGPDVDLRAAGYPVQAFVTLEIAQGALAELGPSLSAVPGVIEAYATTGSGDVVCRVAAESHERLQETLLAIGRCPGVARSTSVVVLSVVVPHRVTPLLRASPRPEPSRVPAYRAGG